MIYVILPSYNEEESLPDLLEAYAGLATVMHDPFKVIVVDDGSKDDTAKVAQSFANLLDIHTIQHQSNKGLGAAFLTGFKFAVTEGAPDDAIVTMDADNTHNPEYIVPMLRKLQSADIVIASRYAPGGKEVGVPAFRSFLSRGASVLYRLFLGIPGVRDYTCGYRMYRLGLIEKAFEFYGDRFVVEKGFSSTGEILVKCAPFAAKIDEVPFELRYDLKGGESKMPKIKTVLQTLTLIRRLRPIARKAGTEAS